MPDKEIIKVKGPPIVAGFRWSVGKVMERFIKSFKDKKILASKCPNCGYAYTPPRSRCGKCHAQLGEGNLVEIPGKGYLVSYTIAHVKLDGKGNFLDLDKPEVIGAIKLDGSDSTIFMPIREVEPNEVKMGMKVEAVWREETKGELADLMYFRPLR